MDEKKPMSGREIGQEELYARDTRKWAFEQIMKAGGRSLEEGIADSYALALFVLNGTAYKQMITGELIPDDMPPRPATAQNVVNANPQYGKWQEQSGYGDALLTS